MLELGRVRLCVCLFDKRGFLKFRASFFNSRAGFDFEARFLSSSGLINSFSALNNGRVTVFKSFIVFLLIGFSKC